MGTGKLGPVVLADGLESWNLKLHVFESWALPFNLRSCSEFFQFFSRCAKMSLNCKFVALAKSHFTSTK